MKSPFRRAERHQPFLAPLGARKGLARFSPAWLTDLPPAAAPIAVTVLGGVALVVALGVFMGGGNDPSPEPSATAAIEAPADAAAIPAPPEPASAAPAPAAPRVETAQLLPEMPPDADDAAAADLEPDPGRTASILAGVGAGAASVPSVPVAETEEEIAALERIQREEVEADVGAPSPEETASTGMRRATATRYVNMRAGPDDDAAVLAVVPTSAEIEAEDDCNWCAVRYEGQSGYIYRSFIRYAD